jgi:hypothetical protein
MSIINHNNNKTFNILKIKNNKFKLIKIINKFNKQFLILK